MARCNRAELLQRQGLDALGGGVAEGAAVSAAWPRPITSMVCRFELRSSKAAARSARARSGTANRIGSRFRPPTFGTAHLALISNLHIPLPSHRERPQCFHESTGKFSCSLEDARLSIGQPEEDRYDRNHHL